MQKLDDAWNARDWDTFDAYHDSDAVSSTTRHLLQADRALQSETGWA
jgi:hypothetical protein